MDAIDWPLIHSSDFNKKLKSRIDSIPNEAIQFLRKINPDGTSFELNDHQKFVQKFFNHFTPYRGLLLQHGVGTGKTCSAIAIADMFTNLVDVVVIVPGPPLEKNFVVEIEKCGNIQNKADPKFYRYRGFTTDLLRKEIENRSLDNKIVIIDEAHGLVSRMMNMSGKSNVAPLLKEWIFGAKNARFIMLTGTPVVNSPRELGMLFNILYGPIEGIRLKLNKYDDDIESALQSNPYVDYYNKSDDKTITLTPVPYGFKKTTSDFVRKDVDFSPSNLESFENKIKEFLKRNKNEAQSISSFKNKTLFSSDPDTYALDTDEFDNMFIKVENDVTNGDIKINTEMSMKNEPIFQSRIRGLVSSVYFNTSEPTTDEKGVLITKKTNFPDIREHPVKVLKMSPEQKNAYQEERIKEINSNLKNKERQSKMENVEDINTFRAKSLGKCTVSFPRDLLLKIENEIGKNSEGKLNTGQDYLYQKRLGEHLRKIKDEEGKYAMYDAMKRISPKFYEIINGENGLMKSDNQTNVVYSKRIDKEAGLNTMMEMMKVMIQETENKDTENDNAFKEYNPDIAKEKGVKYFAYLDSSKKSYEKIKNIFNNVRFDASGAEVPMEEGDKDYNKMGDRIHTLFITGSSSEGITLKNVRNLHIVEHHWNENRMEQVIGRVARYQSHSDLGYDDRNVNIYKYKVQFPENGTDAKGKVYSNDGGATSDETVIAVSSRKEQLISKFLKSMKEVSIDCSDQYKKRCVETKDLPVFHPFFTNKDNTKNEKLRKLITLKKKSWIPKRFHGQRFHYDINTKHIYIDNTKDVIFGTFDEVEKMFLLEF